MSRFMKKELIVHFSFMIAFLALSSIFQKWLSLDYWPIWVGGIMGTLLPDIDNLVSSQFLGNQESFLQNKSLSVKAKIGEASRLMFSERVEAQNLIFHNAQFQLIFVIFTFLLITSSGSLLGIGLVLSFMLHLIIDQIVDLVETRNIDRWFKDFPIPLDGKNKVWYLFANIIFVLAFGFFL